jgi:hypothetical protein
MAIDVGIDHLIDDVSTDRTEKSSAPKMPTPIPFVNLWKTPAESSETTPFGNLMAAFAVLGHGGPMFKQAGGLTLRKD